MRTFLPILVACGGDGATTGDGDTDGGTSPGVTCEDPPTYDLQALSCDQLRDALLGTLEVADACTTAADCRGIGFSCALVSVVASCAHAVNGCFDDARLAPFEERAAECGVDTCACGTVPPVDCVDGSCAFP